MLELVADEAGQPRELGDDARRVELVELQREAAAAGAARAELARADDHHEVLGLEVVRGRGLRHVRGGVGARAGQRLQLSGVRVRLDRLAERVGAGGAGGAVAQLVGERLQRAAQVVDLRHAAGQVDLALRGR